MSLQVLFAHIHFGQEGVNGGVAAFLCGGDGKPACPQGSGTVTGTIVADDVKAIAAQGLAANDIGALIRAIKAGYTYANVHTDGLRHQARSGARSATTTMTITTATARQGTATATTTADDD